ncbi:pyridoxal-phosphate dependent enzyme [Mucilaginibacter sp. RS28]|uniref:Pyridoxal-phosphate dependent enzyme n=1 Tax=Mucilaginibacter straminoryzae TaxID=2932774 RepID=A0A9X2B9U1_9SPHI|nr:pyridoxal-phosphate dependent enzyme [Mucilaginibacter straminoryzae]MCJ8210105.1 pyridoxal-phosphate dependent enzyme [Mucilaginibacter straminoryzae]
MQFDFPIFSPVEQINPELFEQKGLKLFIKRDDLIHPLISGNKWRKLKYTLLKAQSLGKNHLVTFGGAYSNHLLATAAAASKFGLKAIGFVRGEAVDNDTLFLCRLHGMRLIFTDREQYRHKELLFEQHFGNDNDAFFVNEGGASIEGAQGCAELVQELPMVYDHLFCACGTGTTAAGILNGLSQHHLSTRLHAVPVLKNGEFIGEEIQKFSNGNQNFNLHADYHFGGYAKTTPELISFVKEFTTATGILIEPVYTGKMLYAIFDLASQDYFAAGTNILAIHTGGIFGLLGMKEKFR